MHPRPCRVFSHRPADRTGRRNGVLMKKHMLALFLACSMLCTLGACGQQEESSAVGEGNSSLTDSADDSAADSRPADSAAPDNSSKGEESTGRNEQNPESAADTSGSGTDSAAEPSGNTGKPSSGGNDAPGSQGNTSDSGQHTASTTAPRQEQTPSVTTVQAETTPASEIKTITLLGDSVRFEGTGIAARGSRVGITKGGTYRISGSLSDGQIEINTEKKVVLQFDGMSITNSAGSAINVINAKRVTVELMPGTVNSLEDGNVQHDADRGALFTNDTLVIGGSGTLNVKSNYAHGIISDDDIIVNGGTIRIVSTKSGLFANDDISINGGTLFCDAGTNGIKCKNTISINGGTSILMGGTREEKGAIIALGGLTVNGGTLYAIGNTCTLPLASSTQNILAFTFTSALPANTLTRIASGSNPLFTFTSPRAYKTVICSGTGLKDGASYTVSTGGSVTGGSNTDYVITGGSYSGGTDRGTYKSTGRISSFTVS